MAKYLFVDYENVGSNGVTGISQLPEEDSVTILYSKENNKLRFEEVAEVMETTATVKFYKAKNGTPNALDFQLLALLFMTQRTAGDEDEFIIISKDAGYDCTLDAAKAYGTGTTMRKDSIKSVIEAYAETPTEGTMLIEETNIYAPDTTALEEMSFSSAPADPHDDVMDGSTVCLPSDDDLVDPDTTPTATAPKSGKKWERIRTFCAKNKILINDEECHTVSTALNETKDLKGFYSRLHKKHGQKRGVALYKSLKPYYAELLFV